MAGHRLVERGYHSQVTPHEGAISLFHLASSREAIKAVDGHATIGGEPTTLQRLAVEAEQTPAHFSPNVLLRPIVQDAIFPTICYVAGPERARLSRASCAMSTRTSASRCR